MDSHSSEEDFQRRLLKIFKTEASEHIKGIIEGLIEIEKSDFKGDLIAIVDRLFRNAHSLKGSSRTVNLLSVEEICQEMEGIFYDIKKERLSLSESIVEGLHDACVAVEAIIAKPDFPYPYRDIISRLKNLRAISSGERASDKNRDTFLHAKVMATEHPSSEVVMAVSGGTARAVPSGLDVSASQEQMLKIDAKRFEALLNQMEELVSIKGFVNNNLMVLSEIETSLSMLVKGLKVFRNACNSTNVIVDDYGAQSGLRDDFEEPFKNLDYIWHLLQTHQKRCRRDQYFINQKIEDILFALKNVVMMPLSLLFESFPRMIRDIAKMQSKQVETIIEGGEIEVDRRILEEIKDAMIHILRNAVDHGIESPEQRRAVGKNPTASIRVKAVLERGNEIMISVMDDGRGIDIAKLREKLIRQGIAEEGVIREMGDDEVMQYIFKPEISTADMVSNISGRGLGLSIAYEKTENLGGTISVRSEPSKGTAFIIRLPVNVATFKIIVVRGFDGSFYGIPTRNVTSFLRVRPEDIKIIEGKETIDYRGIALSVISIDEALHVNSVINKQEAWRNLLILYSDGKGIAFSVKEILNEEDVFLKGFGMQVKRFRNFTGAATLCSGSTILIINVSDLLKSAFKRGIASSYRIDDLSGAKKKRTILIAEDSITARTLFKGILEGAGYSVATAVDGMDAWNALKTNEFDLLVSDVQMPVMNGFELTARIRNDRKLYSLPVVLVTGLETREDKEKGIEVGANAYIVKSSFEQSNLLEVIKGLL